jgi:hypothetical protein
MVEVKVAGLPMTLLSCHFVLLCINFSMLNYVIIYES